MDDGNKGKGKNSKGKDEYILFFYKLKQTWRERKRGGKRKIDLYAGNKIRMTSTSNEWNKGHVSSQQEYLSRLRAKTGFR